MGYVSITVTQVNHSYCALVLFAEPSQRRGTEKVRPRVDGEKALDPGDSDHRHLQVVRRNARANQVRKVLFFV